MRVFRIFAGLSGSFGGAYYQETTDFLDEHRASEYAYGLARQDYESYEGLHGVMCIDDIMEEERVDEEEAYQIYEEEVENWIDYYVEECTDEDCNKCDYVSDCNYEK